MRPGDDLPDDCKLYVGNLPHNLDDRTLRRMFEPFGNVLHAVVINDQVTGQSRGFGFVHLDSPNTAAAASQAMSGKVSFPAFLPLKSGLQGHTDSLSFSGQEWTVSARLLPLSRPKVASCASQPLVSGSRVAERCGQSQHSCCSFFGHEGKGKCFSICESRFEFAEPH